MSDIFDHFPEIIGSSTDPVVVFEIGVGRGEDSVRMADHLISKGRQYHFVGFEAEKDNCPLIRERCGSKIELLNVAVGDRDGTTSFISSGSWPLSGSVKTPKEHKKSYPWIPWQEPVPIEMIRLDSFISKRGISKIDFIWCDVQGAEDLVIAGGPAALARTRYFYTEFYNTEEYEGQIPLEEIHKRLPGTWSIVKTWDGDIPGSGNVLFKNNTPARRYMIGSGYFPNPCAAIPASEMFDFWLSDIRRHAFPLPSRIVVVTSGGHIPVRAEPVLYPDPILTVIRCQGDIGNLSHKIAGQKSHDFAGWMPPMAITALIAYNEELDFVFQEQDCLAFGPYVERMYLDMGDGSSAIGRAIGGMGMPATQSLFLVRHAYIWQFIRDYFVCGPDDNDQNQGEKKFARMRDAKPADIRSLSFGVDRDRDRPLPLPDPVWYAQQWSRAEIDSVRASGLLP